MTSLLHLQGSPRNERSASLAIAKTFIDSYKKHHPQDTITTINPWSMDLPEFDEFAINAKFNIMHGRPHSEREGKAWETITSIFNQFNSADKYLFSIPMWNFSLPYKIKHYIDIITQPSLAFTVTEEGYEGLVKDKPALVIYASGGDYSSEQMRHFDFQKNYFEFLLRFIGFSHIHTLVVQPTIAEPDVVAKAKEHAQEEAKTFAAMF